MSYTLRPYQEAAVDSLFEYFSSESGNPILSLPTGSGKSIIQAEFVRRVRSRWPDERFLLVSHVKELLVQNTEKIAALIPDTPIGIYSAGLGRKELGYPVTVAGIQSAYKHAHEMGEISIVMIDECHLVNKAPGSMYQGFLDTLRQLCPRVRVIGMSATPFRLDSGPLTRGEHRIFTDIAHTVSIKDLIADGYLAPLVTAPTKTKARADGVKKRGGEYVTGDLEAFMNTEAITEAALTEVDSLCADRQSWLVFCVGVDHARDVAQAIRLRGHSAEIVIGDTPKDMRAQRLDAFKRGELRALVSVGVLTTGFDAPNADALICLRPTMSPGLWVQMVGRVSRTSPGKTDGLVLDFTGNTHTHGPIDLIDIDGDGNVRTSPYRVCPECGEMIEPKRKSCSCGYSFERECATCHALFDRDLAACPECGTFVKRTERKVEHNTEASSGEIISTNQAIVEDVEFMTASRHKKEGKPDSLKITYYFDEVMYRKQSEWLCFEHEDYAALKAAQRWVELGGDIPIPATVDEALTRQKELETPTEIRRVRDGKYWRVLPVRAPKP